jgi:hypothetical protein
MIYALLIITACLWGAYKIGKSFIETWDEIGKASMDDQA